MLGTIVFVEEPRSKAEQGAEFSQKIFSSPGVTSGFSRACVCEPPPMRTEMELESHRGGFAFDLLTVELACGRTSLRPKYFCAVCCSTESRQPKWCPSRVAEAIRNPLYKGSHPRAFVLFLSLGCLLVGLGVLLYLYSLVLLND